MGTGIDERLRGLTEKERTTLRLMLRGHDAKSIARSLGLSVHTVNERLRDARRKLEVSSSREAARLLFEAEQAGGRSAPEIQGDRKMGADGAGNPREQSTAPADGAGRAGRPLILVGGAVMMIALGVLAFAAAAPQPAAPTAATVATDAASPLAVQARQWLELLDQGRWEDSYQSFGSAFRKQNSVKIWADASEQARTPLGAAVSRSFLGQESLPAPPAGYQVVKFRTRFANRADPIVETVTFEREDGGWRVVGVMLG